VHGDAPDSPAGHPRYVTVTVPEEPRNVLRANQRDGYAPRANGAPAEPKTRHLSQLAFLQRCTAPYLRTMLDLPRTVPRHGAECRQHTLVS